MGCHVEVVTSSYVETDPPGIAPVDLARMHARGKLEGTPPQPHLVVAADTVVDLDGVPLGKPRDVEDARTMLTRLSGRWHAVHTAFALRDDRSGARFAGCVTTRVRFADLNPDTIDAYARSGDGLDKAGAYGIQGYAATLVERIEGDYFTVVGFPLSAFAAALPSLGYRLSAPGVAAGTRFVSGVTP